MDYHMPKMDGYKATKTLNRLIKDREISNTMIIACSADITKANYKKCKENDFDLLIGKPIDKVYLKKLLN